MIEMTKRHRFLFVTLVAFVLIILEFSCTKSEYQNYTNEILEWRKQRFETLKAPYGWPSVIGLYPLRSSILYFGGSITNDILIAGKAESSYGYLEKTDLGIQFHGYSNIGIKMNDELVSSGPMKTDKDLGGPTLVSCGSFQWHIIDRQGNYFLRMKDSLSSYRAALEEIPYFPIDTSLRISAKFQVSSPGDSTQYKNELGMTITNPIMGKIIFQIKDQEYQFSALENDVDSYFIIFGDLTNGEESYGGGRFLYPLKESLDGTIILDFNKSINPPCVFTPFATCPFPPEENKLPLKIHAGEKYLKIY